MDLDVAAIRLSLPGRPEYVRLGRLALAGLAHARPLPAEALADLKLALTEACSLRRASAHGSGRYDITFELHDDGRLVVEIVDGDGFVPVEAPESEAAMGMAIIRAVVDEVELGPTPADAPSRLRFVKQLPDNDSGRRD